ncbi:hypothetical protein HBB16_04960 [Pseudonocardia sp. MCCB 268]|nr:hypothetical protein [Pseudonocardia cytotoxica]
MIEMALRRRRPQVRLTRADLTRAINAALPDYLGAPDGDAVAELLDQLTTRRSRCAVAMDAERPGEHVCPTSCA